MHLKKVKKSILIDYANLILGIFLLFLLLTDVEFNSTAANFLFPLAAHIFGNISYRKLSDARRGKIFFYLPSFIGSICFYAAIILICILSFWGAVFWFFEETSKTKIQHSYSPNKIEYCDAYHYPVGAYARGTGRLRIFLVNRFIPFFRREIFYKSHAYILMEEDEATGKKCIDYDVFEWDDKDNIRVYAQESVVNVRGLVFYPCEILKHLRSKNKLEDGKL